MLGTLIRKELLDHFLSLRFMVSTIIVILILLMSVFVLKQDFVARQEAFQVSVTKGRELASQSETYFDLMFMGIRVSRPPSKLQFLYSGVEKNPDTKTVIRSFLKPSFQGDLNLNPIFPLFPVVDLLFVVSIVLSLLAFVYSYDAVCGERERGTLKLLMSYSIPRDKIILSKWIGGYVSLIIPFMISIFVIAVFIALSGNLNFHMIDWQAYGLTTLVSMLFIAVMYSVGLFVSVVAKRSNTSISILLLMWVIFVLVIPNVSPFVVDQVVKIDSVSKTQAELQAKTGEQMQDLMGNMMNDMESIIQRADPNFSFRKVAMFDGKTAEQLEAEKKSGVSAVENKPAPEQQSGGGGGNQGGGGQSAAESEARDQAAAAGVDLSSMAGLVGDITDADLRDMKTFGCETFIDNKIREVMGISLEDAKTMARDYGVKASDIDRMLRECDIMRKRYIRDLEQARAAATEQQGGDDTGAAATQLPKETPDKPAAKEVYQFQDLIGIMARFTDKDKKDLTETFWGGFVDTMQENMREANRVWEERDKKVNRQMRLTKWISRISPVSAYVYAATDLADTGVEHDIYLREDVLSEYQSQFSKYLESQLGMPFEEMKRNLIPQTDVIRQPDLPENTIKELEPFEPLPMSITQRIKKASIDIGALFIFAIFFFMLAYMSFLRSQIID